ncbi:hypothetical protein GCM10011578_073800 [Streptomyces fuscichromogenes]|uniref:Uncharacterized protein n=1 Tax=Streptomyces fuscichromogenes TaxID=1324013 RepID=A0A918CVF8_9ACTN|nr:hypothetical protein GCM10011578_073800 [Streptomyces fuscichromogenes]
MFFVCWWYTPYMALTSTNAGFEAGAAGSGPYTVRILVVSRAKPDSERVPLETECDARSREDDEISLKLSTWVR